jgi:hypothetical protein
LYDFRDRKELLTYLGNAKEMGAIFSYMSVIIIKNAVWREAPDNRSNYGSCYAHINKIFGILLKGGLLKYIETPLVLNRSFNDSFLENGILNRYLIDFRGIIGISKILFPDDLELRRHMVNLMILEHPWYQLVKIKSCTNDRLKWEEIKKGLLEYGCKEDTLRFVEALGKYKNIVKVAAKLKATINKHFIRRYIYAIRQQISVNK